MSGSYPLAKFIGFAAVCVVAAALLVAQLTNAAPFEDRRSFEAVMPTADGLLHNDPVKIAGVDVGRVEDVRIEQGRAVVTFTVDADRALGSETQLGVRWRNLFGLRFLYLYPAGEGDLPDGHQFTAADLRPSTDLTAFLARLTPVMRALDPDVSNIVVRSLTEALAGREDEVRALVGQAGSLLNAVAGREDELGGLISNGAVLVDAYAAREQELRDLLARFAEVSETVAERNDMLVDAVSRIADAGSEVHRLAAANEGEIRASIAELDAIMAVLSVYHDEVEQLAAHTGTAIVQYHRISRWGQWFNIRVPGLSTGEQTNTTERGAELPARMDPDEDGEWSRPPSSGAAAFFSVHRYEGGDPQ